jgi:hypothetical protein
MDLLAALTAFNWAFCQSRSLQLGVLVYIAASRAYSWRGIRLKQLSLSRAFATVFLFQGAWVYWFVTRASGAGGGYIDFSHGCLHSAASCLIGALYPLTQVYQHEADRADGVTTTLLQARQARLFCIQHDPLPGRRRLAAAAYFLTGRPGEPFLPLLG